MFGARQHLDQVLCRQVRAEQQHGREVQLAAGNSVEKLGKASQQPCRAHAPKRRIFRELQLVNAIRVHTGAGAAAMNAARFDLPQVRQQCPQQLIRGTDEPARDRKQLGIGKVGELRRE